jgi:hypothetical protein
MLLTPEKIQQTIKDAHQKRPGVILPVKEIYEALARAQHRQDGDWLEKYVHSLAEGWGNTWPMCVPIQFLRKGYQYEYPCR